MRSFFVEFSCYLVDKTIMLLRDRFKRTILISLSLIIVVTTISLLFVADKGGLIGSMLGGIGTLIAVLITINHSDATNEKNRRIESSRKRIDEIDRGIFLIVRFFITARQKLPRIITDILAQEDVLRLYLQDITSNLLSTDIECLFLRSYTENDLLQEFYQKWERDCFSIRLRAEGGLEILARLSYHKETYGPGHLSVEHAKNDFIENWNHLLSLVADVEIELKYRFNALEVNNAEKQRHASIISDKTG